MIQILTSSQHSRAYQEISNFMSKARNFDCTNGFSSENVFCYQATSCTFCVIGHNRSNVLRDCERWRLIYLCTTISCGNRPVNKGNDQQYQSNTIPFMTNKVISSHQETLKQRTRTSGMIIVHPNAMFVLILKKFVFSSHKVHKVGVILRFLWRLADRWLSPTPGQDVSLSMETSQVKLVPNYTWVEWGNGG